MAQKARILTGLRFGKLTVGERIGSNKYGRPLWACVCDCGKKTTLSTAHLMEYNTKSCGCYRGESSKLRNTKHGMKGTRLYEVWKGMKKRCYSPQNPNYRNYGMRGISICDEWRCDFKAFYDWAMANGYDPNAPRGEKTIERKDVNGNYCPENCCWITISEQQRNKRNNKSK